jgi:tetratricopeptide (TPR) repeat protein
MKTPLIAIILLGSALAYAEPKTPDEWYKEGENQYTLQAFDKAIEAFKKGFELESNESKRSAYLFNIAQSYRQLKSCKDALFFYKRYLAARDADTKKPLKPAARKDTEQKIAEQEACAKEQEAAAEAKAAEDKRIEEDKARQAREDQEREAREKRVAEAGKEPKDNGIVKVAPQAHGSPIAARLTGGATKIATGGLGVPIQAVVGLTVGHPLKMSDTLTLELGAGFTFAPVPYDDMITHTSRTAQFTTAVANLGVTFKVAPKIAARVDVGGGVLILGGVSESPFTDEAPTTGALVMPIVRAGLAVDYTITPNLFATVAPILFSFSPKKDGLSTDIKSIEQFDFMVGIGYRM